MDEPYLGYRCHLNKLSCGWRPLFQKHRAFDSFRKLEAFYREHQADLEIYDEYGRQYSWEEYFETVYAHSRCQPEPMKWVYEVTTMSPDKKPHLRTVGCSEEEAELYTLFHDTLRNNLTMYQEVSDNKLFDVLKSVGLDRYANTQALDGIITESGSNFSGGEKKRICLARAMLRDTDVLVFDEPLANLDIATAERIEDLLLSIKNKTILVVSHQFTDEKLCDFDQVIDFVMEK